MDINKIKSGLKTDWLGSKIHYQPSVDSTNSWAARTINSGCGRGEVFLTDFQSKGQGRLDRTWESPSEKNILLSLVDNPPPDTKKTHQLTLIAGIGFLDGLKNIFPETALSLKWPNDIILSGKKLGGILSKHQNNSVVIGVGINVNTTLEDFSPTIRNTAISLKIFSGKEYSREEIIASCLNSYEEWRNIYETKGIEIIIKNWEKRSDIFGKSVKITEPHGSFEGIVEMLDADGFLLVKAPDGIKQVISGDVIPI